MSAVDSVLVVGAGLAGCAVATVLADAGVAVDLVDSKPDTGALGSGITLQGNALRELRRLGLWEVVSALGFSFDSTVIRAPDGTVLHELREMRTGGPDVPAIMGMPRPTLARLMLARAESVGVKVRLGTTHTSLDSDDEGVDVTLTDGSTGRYDLVVGADGVRSATRRALGIDLETLPIGMGIWRVFASRPASVTCGNIYYGGESYIAGITPTSENSLYAYVVEPLQDRFGMTPAEKLATLRELSRAYGGPWDDLREELVDASLVNYTAFETHVLPRPWNRGRVVFIGDAAHTCPPTLAQGGAQALEDAVVLGELLTRADRLDQALWDEFAARRVPRATAVVAASNQLCTWLLAREQGDVPGLMATTTALVSQPA